VPRKKKSPIPLTAKQQAHIASLALSYQDGYAKALSGTSMAMAVKMKCRDCCGYEDAANRVRTCTDTTCALWPYRR
jgi:hypothetical protein